MMRAQNPDLAAKYLAQLKKERPQSKCLQAATQAQEALGTAGYQTPQWDLVWNGVRPEQVTESEPGEWRHGWQYFAATTRDEYARNAALENLDTGSQALLRSQSGPGAGLSLQSSQLQIRPEFQLMN